MRLQKSKVKIMLIIFDDSDRIIHKEYVPQNKIVNGDYYLDVIKCLLAGTGQVRPQYRTLGSWSLLYDNAPAHKCIAVRKFLASKTRFGPHS